jgi:hypothetical protein
MKAEFDQIEQLATEAKKDNAQGQAQSQGGIQWLKLNLVDGEILTPEGNRPYIHTPLEKIPTLPTLPYNPEPHTGNPTPIPFYSTCRTSA